MGALLTAGITGTAHRHFCWQLRRPDRLQKARQLRRGLVLWHRLQFLECTREGVRQAPHRPRLELLMHGLKVQIMDTPRQVLGKPGLLLDERLIDQKLCRGRGQLQGTPFLDLLLQRSEVPLHAVHADGQAVFE